MRELVEMSALKLIDDATLFSKENVINEYENNKDAENLNELLHEKSIYSNGEKLGFYNISKFTFNDFLEKDLSEKEFNEYLNGFSIEIRELFSILKPEFSKFNDLNVKLGRQYHNMNYVKNKLDVQNNFIKMFYEFSPYINYEAYSTFLRNILFDDMNFKKNISILHINPDNLFIFDCLKYIQECDFKYDVNLFVIANNLNIAFSLKFLAILNKINFKFVINKQQDSKNKYDTDYNKLFNFEKNFDFVIQSDAESKCGRIPDSMILSNYELNISSRAVYLIPFCKNFINEDWLDEDILESLIILPIKAKTIKYSHRHLKYPLMLLIVLNYNKSIERKDKSVIIDNTKNKIITNADYNYLEYVDLINNSNIYSNSFKQFSKFSDTDNSIVIYNDEILNNSIADELNISDLLYDVKMVSQKNYYKIEYLKKNPSGKDKIISKQLDYKIVKLEDLTERVHHQSKGKKSVNTHNHLYLLTNKFPVDKWAFFDFEIKNHKLYEKMKLTSNKVSIEYLYYYLNSQMGLNELEYFSRGYTQSYGLFLGKIRVPLPPIEIQDQIVNAMNKSKNFFNEVNQLKNRINTNFLDYKKNLKTMNEFYTDNIHSEETHELSISNHREYTLSGLVWPLAITYLLATSGGLEKTETANNLLRLFEFTVAFNAIVLISGLPEEIYEEYKTRIWDYAYDKSNNNYKFKKSLKLTFGSWVEFTNLLSSAYKKEFETDLNKEFYINLLNKEIRKYYTKLKDERNEEFHSGIATAEDAKSLINELDIPKAKIFEHLNLCYNNFKLYYTTAGHDTETNEYEVIFLNGAYSMPIYSTVRHKGHLEPKSLYLYDTVEKKFSKLNDKLINFKALDEGKRDWRLYIFIGFETVDNTKKAVYKCYQLKEKKDPKEDIDLNDFM